MYDIKIIESGYIMADGGAMFGAIPKRYWQRKYPSDKNNQCPLAMRCLLLVSEGRKILIDAGLGNKNLNQIAYYQPHGLSDVAGEIKKYGYNVEDVTDVVLTHLHFDHCGGATSLNDAGEAVPSYPNARYWISRGQWDALNNPNKLEGKSFFKGNIMPVYKAGQLCFVDEDMSPCDGLQFKLSDGHTQGQIVPYISTANGVFVFPGDVIPTSAHVSLAWISAYDLCAIISLGEKERLLAESVVNDYTLIYCHDVSVAGSKVKRLNNDFKAADLIKV